MMAEQIKKLYFRYRQIILYIIFGGITTVVSFSVYILCYRFLAMPNVPAEILSWVCAVTTAFVTNKLFVFESKSRDAGTVLKEAAAFYGMRLGSGIFDTLFMWVTVDLLGFEGILMKLIVEVGVVIFNYVASKFIIFKKK